MFPSRQLAIAALTPVLVVAAAGAATAAYPPSPDGSSAQSATSITAGGSVNFTFGDPAGVRYMPNSTVAINCTGPDGASLGTVTAANSAGVAATAFTFTTPGVWVCAASGTAPDGAPLTITAKPVNVTPAGQGVAPSNPAQAQNAASPASAAAVSTAATQSGDLAQTGGGNVLVTAAVGAGLLLAGVGAVIVARRTSKETS